MIYLIDDKSSRRSDYGWGNERLEKYNEIITCVSDENTLLTLQEEILKQNNVILYHESFIKSCGQQKVLDVKDFINKLDSESEKSQIHVAYFSGSKCSRKIDGQNCYLTPQCLYSNLDSFIEHIKASGEINFNYLLFGSNPSVEKTIREQIESVNDYNIDYSKIESQINICFLRSFERSLAVKAPFKNIHEILLGNDLNNDLKLDQFVNNSFSERKFDAIYVPLCFGSVLSDFLGLRLALHIRLTNTINKLTPIIIYGEVNPITLLANEFIDVLKMHGVKYSSGKNDEIIAAINDIHDVDLEDYKVDLKTINLKIPSDYGDNHSIANEWGANILTKIVTKNFSEDKNLQRAKENLYFKYLTAKTESESISLLKDEAFNKVEAKGKNILIIDDEAQKGWDSAISEMFIEAHLETHSSRITKYEDLPNEIKDKFTKDFYDLVFLDLRLNGSDENVKNPTDFSGMKVLKGIKTYNEGVQVIIMTASNKAWNMKALLDEGADGYYIKESPECNYSFNDSFENALKLRKQIADCISHCFLKQIWINNQISIENLNHFSTICLSNKRIDTIKKQIEMSYAMITRDKHNNNLLSYAFVSLEQILEMISKYFLKEDKKSGYILKENGEICSNWKINSTHCVEDDQPQGKDYPMWKKISSIYYQLYKESDKKFGYDMQQLIQKRNDFMHTDINSANNVITVEDYILLNERICDLTELFTK